MNIILLLFIGVSLSMDTFSLALSLGTFSIKRKDCVLFSLIVAIFHFCMPIVGAFLGASIQSFIVINPNKLLAVVLFFIALEMIIDLKNHKEGTYDFSVWNMILYAFSVSIDSLTIGVGLSGFTKSPFLGSVIFSFTSFIFTFVGLHLGSCCYKRIGKIANILGIIIIIALAILHLGK